MSTLTFTINDEAKKEFRAKSHAEGTTLTFVMNKMIEAYNKGFFGLGMFIKNEEAFPQKKDPDYLLFERDPKLGDMAEELSKALDKKYRKETSFPSLEAQLKDI